MRNAAVDATVLAYILALRGASHVPARRIPVKEKRTRAQAKKRKNKRKRQRKARRGKRR